MLTKNRIQLVVTKRATNPRNHLVSQVGLNLGWQVESTYMQAPRYNQTCKQAENDQEFICNQSTRARQAKKAMHCP